MTFDRGEKIYEGKAKTLYAVRGQPHLLIQEFKNSLTALNGAKKGSFDNKGTLNRKISSLVFKFLASKGVQHHLVSDQGENEMVVQKLQIIPLEVVVRNVAAGSLAKRFGWDEGKVLDTPLVEFYFKDDALGDPFINDEQAVLLGACSYDELTQLKKYGREINLYLKEFYDEVGLTLIDFKMEFGRLENGKIILADEITPDCCRLWDQKTNEKMDKDRFRRDLGRIQETYEEVYQRLEKYWGTKL